MKAAYFSAPGPPEVIQYGELPQPSIGPSEVLVRMAAVAVNPIDTYIRNGANYWPLPNPYIIGCDLAGEVIEVGERVRRFRVGDRVWCSNQGLMGRSGTFAEFCSIDEQWLYPLPPQVDYEVGAGIALVGITAHLGLFARAKLQAGEIILVRGGSGGVGSVVVQMAKRLGARVLATAGSPDKARACQELGADHVVLYRDQDELQAVREFAPQGVDVLWETARVPNFDRSVEMLAERGRMILMAGRDARPEFPVGPFYVKQCQLHGFVMFKATAEEQRTCAEEINRWLAEGSLKPRISHRLKLEQAAEAHRIQEQSTVHLSGELAGKIVLVP